MNAMALETAEGFKQFTELYKALNPNLGFSEWLLDNFNYLGATDVQIIKNWRNI